MAFRSLNKYHRLRVFMLAGVLVFLWESALAAGAITYSDPFAVIEPHEFQQVDKIRCDQVRIVIFWSC
jgi:hypothetical protein